MSDISSDEDTPPKRLQAKKLKLYTRRKQKFLKELLNNTNFNIWLMPDLSDKYKARCKLCNLTFTAELTMIKNHGKCKNHVSNEFSFYSKIDSNIYSKKRRTIL